MTLPIFLTSLKDLSLMQTKWASILNVLLTNPSLNSNILHNIELKTGTNVINHLLDRKLLGWRIIGINGISNIYDTQSSNQSPNLTLMLVSSAPVICNLEVF